MIPNVGIVDRGIRLVAGLILAGFGWQLFGNTGLGEGGELLARLAAGVMVLTALARFCPFYRLFGVSSCVE